MSNENKINISPNLLKNFNPFDILEPQKDVGTNVDRLIDLDNPAENSHLNVSLLDQKINYDLIDLYQNMYVTPQHVNANTKKNEDCKENTTINVDYKGFFDMLESGKPIDWTKHNLEDIATKTNDKEMTRAPKVLEPPTLLKEDNSDPEDLIYEVIANKTLEKNILSEQFEYGDNTIAHSKPVENYSYINEFPKPKILTNCQSKIDLKTPTKTIKDINNKCINNKATISVEIQAEKAAYSHFDLKNSIFKDFNDRNIPQTVNTKIEGQNKNLPVFKVIAVKKDEKAFKKNRNVKPDSQKCNYTKGADFAEKSVVLPQMMANIYARQSFLEEKNSKKRRLILDSGMKSGIYYKLFNFAEENVCKNLGLDKMKLNSNHGHSINSTTKSTDGNKNCCHCLCKTAGKSSANLNPEELSSERDDKFGEVSPIVLMADCNKERLKALRQSQMFKQFVMTGK